MIVNFWASWCPPCRRELPSMNRAWARFQPQGIMMLAINVGEDEDTIFPFMADYPIDFPVLLDRDGETIRRWPVRGLPTTFVIDPRGRIVYQAVGGREWDDRKLLDKVRNLKAPH
jgi:peroxiredoxin